jgi:hypothetical protein
MELEEMNTLWVEMSKAVENQKKITDSLIIKMTRSNFKNKLSRILIPEFIGAFVCFAGMFCVLVNFQKLNNWYLILCGIFSILILCLLPILSLGAIRKISSVKILHNDYKQTLLSYSKGKLRFVFIQKFSFVLGMLLFVAILPVMGKLIGGRDFFVEDNLWIWYTAGFPFFYAFSRWVFKRYMKTTAEAENILKDLEN